MNQKIKDNVFKSKRQDGKREYCLSHLNVWQRLHVLVLMAFNQAIDKNYIACTYKFERQTKRGLLMMELVLDVCLAYLVIAHLRQIKRQFKRQQWNWQFQFKLKQVNWNAPSSEATTIIALQKDTMKRNVVKRMQILASIQSHGRSVMKVKPMWMQVIWSKYRI